MSSINHFDLRSFDLNLLVAFDALMQERSVTRAAARLRVGQPAMSHSLSTLRVLFQDELFVRVGTAMQPTARARALAGPIRTALAQMQTALHARTLFDPATEERTLRLGFSSEVELLLIPELTAHIRQSAPGIRLLCRPADKDEVHRMLDDGTLDLAVGCFDAVAQRHRSRFLFEQSLSCVFNTRHVALGTPIGLADYLAAPHALVTWTDSLQGCLEAALIEIGADLNIVVAGSEFLTVLATVACAPVITTIPTRMARLYGPRFGLTVCPAPLTLRLPAVAMIWSLQLDQDPASAWFRDQVAGILLAAEMDVRDTLMAAGGRG
ncbi:LysR family transcriptional regulator [Azospirillum sp. RWY-5-1]|uniref:LysR family transcriptional regulator n=1 Tax=Azospirillum oleiclasticum TaxID=2735135 RepID=A0ABX2TAS3_9PROT|nr:LysR family transcriptional regulator [Azospirillum oleiclasticum]NYZ13860.1 LysR family transcriptional regulator [Azospirillum oleiclasticum]NYZ21132.1 LysR family transcriptional regulator [Azospirillum oleiclasticum]